MSLTTALSSMDTLNLIALMCVVFIGLPHGAMDGALAAHFGWMESKKKAATFLIGYVAMAALVVGFWFVAPAISFIIFLGISMYHFGKGDVNTDGEEPSVTESLARGGVVIGGISQFHRVDADEIFQVLIGSNTELVWLFLNSVVPMTLIFAILSMVNKTTGERGSLLAEIAGLALIFSILPPLVGFAIYFCLIHSIRHFASMRAMLSDTITKLQITKTTILFSAISWAAGLIILAQQSSNIGFEPALLQVIFIGLAALTVPHMILVDGYTEYQKSQ
ncbi:MAG: hypothetical protein CMB55_07350 [Euryarchaeota archaeon]|nr:hypothetical protein [Euryarchaeota archaeon]|tara:strand:+ start:213 stop:1043 length:831 start_codon:yes stop_codon:yes gene_type:complete